MLQSPSPFKFQWTHRGLDWTIRALLSYIDSSCLVRSSSNTARDAPETPLGALEFWHRRSSQPLARPSADLAALQAGPTDRDRLQLPIIPLREASSLGGKEWVILSPWLAARVGHSLCRTSHLNPSRFFFFSFFFRQEEFRNAGLAVLETETVNAEFGFQVQVLARCESHFNAHLDINSLQLVTLLYKPGRGRSCDIRAFRSSAPG